MATGNQGPSAERLPAVEWLGGTPRERVATLKPALARFFGLTEADRGRLRDHRSLFASNVEELTGRFYDHLLETPETAAYFSGWSRKRLRTLSRKQTDYFLRMLDADFGAGRTREILNVAERHQRLGIPSTWIGAAYAVYLNYGRGRIEAAGLAPRLREQLFNAFERLVFVDRELQLLGYDSDRRLREFHGALAEINQLIAHKPPVETLYRGVCRIAVQRCGLPLAWIGLVAADGVGVDIAAVGGVQSEFTRNLKLSLDPDSLLSRGAFGRVIRSGAMVVIPDMEAVKGRDLLAKRALGHGLRAMAVLPIRRGDAIIGAMAVYDREADAFTTTVVPLLQTLAADVSYAVTEFRHEAEIERLHEFSLALSDVNQLIARGCQAPRLYAESCQVIARHARVFLACIIRAEPDAAGARVAGSGGEGRPFTERLAAVLTQETNAGHRRGRAPAVHNDLRSPALSARCRAALELFGVGSWAAFPLRSDNGDDYGDLVVLARQEDYFSRDLVRLLEETAGDLGFAVADQARRKKLAEVQGFYAALGNLGALVAACGDAAQLIDHACRLVVAHAGVALAGVVHVDAGSGEVRVRAVAGMLAEYARRVVLSIDPDQPEGAGVVGRVHRSGQSAVVEDTADEPAMQAWRVPPAKYGLHAVAGFPMATDGTGETILILGADEPGYFSPPLVDLLERIARALGAGLSHIAAAERARRLETLYAALSSVNELIARYPDPLELFTETCHDLAAQLSGVSALVLEAGGDDGPRVAAAAGPGSAEKALQECLQRLLQESGNLRSGQEALFNRVPEADELARWRERCAGLGIRSLGLFPIAHEGGTMGALAIVSSWQDLFDDELAGLFKRLAANLSFALDQHSRGEALQRLAFTDSLTALPNRALFLDRLQQSVAEAARDNRSLAVGIVDLDGFKQINDRLGHPVGDYVLKEIGRRFAVVSRESDTVARFGGDEFGLVLRNPHGEAEVQGFLERLLAVISRPIKVERERFVLGASVGISLYPQDAETPDELMRLADLAMYRTKQRGGHGWTFYTEAMERRLLVAHGIQRDFARALRADELELNYQPQLDFTNGRILGAEALVRWRHPDRGVLPPSGWIEVVEQNGQMVRALGKRVLALAIAQLAAWHRCGLRLSVSVNVGVRHILSPHFLDDLDAALAETPELAPWLGLEITESALIEDFETCRERLQECRRRGLRLAIDDFGVGHASLRYLHQLPVDAIKIDKSFVRNLHDDLRALGIVAGALQASRFSQINAVAEGVETLEQGVVLRRLGCRVMQGYAVARPMAAEAFGGWRRKWVMPAEWEEESRHAVGAGHLPLVASMTYHRGVARSLGERSRRRRDAEKRDAMLPSDDTCPLRRWGQGWEAGAQMAPELAAAHARLHELEAAAAYSGRADGGEGDPRVEAARALVEFLDRAEACLRELPPA